MAPKRKAQSRYQTYTPAKRAKMGIDQKTPFSMYGSKIRSYRKARSSANAAERKFFDTALSFSFDSTAEVPATGQLCLIPQGDTESTRDGRKAVIESVQIRGHVDIPPGAGTTLAGQAHMWLVLDTQTNGAAAAFTDVFTETDVSKCLLQLNNSGRFRILKHWTWTYKPAAGVSTAWNNESKAVDFYTRCNVPMDWNSTAGAITEIRSNNLFLMAGQVGIGDDVPTFTGNARVRFQG